MLAMICVPPILENIVKKLYHEYFLSRGKYVNNFPNPDNTMISRRFEEKR
jgi:hypothetical protein